MIEYDKRILTNRLEEKALEVNMISQMQLEIMNKMMISNHEFNGKDIEMLKIFSFRNSVAGARKEGVEPISRVKSRLQRCDD